ncbi:hypothetical protein BKA70DRAFT_1403378 [Coprinopsis sp. MPI-PUGE-AT-0042]|nr:hypothetical protein BKA70DRAFT_1403378 [Coprinopsis sp. MPI-PUGE-AT-0042]
MAPQRTFARSTSALTTSSSARGLGEPVWATQGDADVGALWVVRLLAVGGARGEELGREGTGLCDAGAKGARTAPFVDSVNLADLLGCIPIGCTASIGDWKGGVGYQNGELQQLAEHKARRGFRAFLTPDRASDKFLRSSLEYLRFAKILAVFYSRYLNFLFGVLCVTPATG